MSMHCGLLPRTTSVMIFNIISSQAITFLSPLKRKSMTMAFISSLITSKGLIGNQRGTQTCPDHSLIKVIRKEIGSLLSREHLSSLTCRIFSAGKLTLNIQQRALYQAVLDSVEHGQGGLFFIHSREGWGKTYLSKLIVAAVHTRNKVVLCVASTGLASLLLPGGHTAHSRFKIPIPTNEQSTCNLKKNDIHHQLLQQTSLIIWDEVCSQHIMLWNVWIDLSKT
ncbi:hypothetical protein ID866_9982 [Astraeus odoratus]|nr:hypothetical protein ID866_9982 [Astraeus odoratus]